MKFTLLAGSVIVVAAALAVYAVPAVPAVPAAPARHISCTLRNTTLIEPGSTSVDPTATKGHDFGNETCARPLGRGVHVDGFRLAPESSTMGTATGRWKSFFNTGTYHGTYKLSYTATSSTQITYSGSGPITGGTGSLRDASGRIELRCSSDDGGIHTLCQVKVTLR